jgi:hypothetical protein
MIFVDGNLLIYFGVAQMPQHWAADRWFREFVATGHRIGIPWPLAFLRITTNPRLFAQPAAIDVAMRQVEGWLRLPMVWVPGPTERHGKIFATLLRQSNGTGNLVADCHLAALAIEHGLEMCSADGDFARFTGLRWVNPLRG